MENNEDNNEPKIISIASRNKQEDIQVHNAIMGLGKRKLVEGQDILNSLEDKSPEVKVIPMKGWNEKKEREKIYRSILKRE